MDLDYFHWDQFLQHRRQRLLVVVAIDLEKEMKNYANFNFRTNLATLDIPLIDPGLTLVT